MTSAAHQALLASFLDEAKAARLAGNTEAVLAWETAAARLTQSEADSLQTGEPPEDRAADPAKVQLAARQCERMARFFADRSDTGEAKATGYRHAVHIFRLIGGLDLPEPAALRADPVLPGTVPAPDLFA